jgi:pyruvate dehydrogenase complex dehydrogenase (E1) component
MVMDRVKERMGVRSEPVRQHLRNSRIELLKAIRSMIDDRISHLSRGGEQQGTKVVIE